MCREIKELLKLAAVHAPLYGFLKLFCTFLSALFVPANALLLQRILDGLVSFSCSGRLPADWYRDLVWMAGLLLGEGLLTGTDGLLAVRFEMQVTDRLETRLMEKLRNLEYSRMEEPQIQDLLSGISQNPSREICSAFWKLSEGLRTAGTLAGMLAIYLWKAFISQCPSSKILYAKESGNFCKEAALPTREGLTSLCCDLKKFTGQTAVHFSFHNRQSAR